MPSGDDRWDVFLAHAGPDTDRARVLYDALTALGLRVFLDAESLLPGDDWTTSIPGHIRRSKVVLALLSRHTGDAYYTHEEITLAVQHAREGSGGRLIPVELEPDVAVPYGLRTLGRLPLHHDIDAPAVARQIAALIDATRGPGPVFSPRIPPVPLHFMGREAELTALGSGLRSSTGSPSTQIVEGMGGMGKTALVAALCHAHRDRHDVIWWVRADDPTALVGDLADLAGEVGAALGDGGDADAQRAFRWLEQTERRWLLVFDDAPDLPTINRWRPRGGNGDVVITTRHRHFSSIGRVHALRPFSGEMSEAFLRDRVGPRNPEAADEDLGPVVERLAGLPLALEQAAAWVERLPSRRFAQWVESYDLAQGPAGNESFFAHAATGAWEIALAGATVEAPVASLLLSGLSNLASNRIPAGWLRDAASSGDPFLDGAPSDDVDDALASLGAQGLITTGDDDMISIHPVVQEFARRSAPDGAAAFAARLVTTQARGHLDVIDWATLDALAPHARRVAEHLPPDHQIEASALVSTLSLIAHAAADRGQLEVAIGTATAAMSLAQVAFPDEPMSATATFALAHAHDAAGDIPRAISLYESALARTGSRDVVGDTTLLGHRTALAHLYFQAGELHRAIPLYEAILADSERLLGPDSGMALTSRSNLAGVYRSLGDLERATALYETTLADSVRLLGPDHPVALTSRSNLAGVYRSLGDLERATALYETTLADSVRILGPDHPDTLTSRNNLAGAYRDAGDIQGAIALYEATLAARVRILGPDHADTLTSRSNLAGAYGEAGDLQHATDLYRETLAEAERILGPGHPTTLISCNNLAVTLQATGHMIEAVDLFERALEGFEVTLGSEHPRVGRAQENLLSARAALRSTE